MMQAPKGTGLLSALVFIGLFGLLALTPRIEIEMLMALYTGLFVIYGTSLKKADLIGIRGLVVMAIAVRVPFLFDLPQLSDDYFRFLWDGHLILSGVNPFADSPLQIEMQSLKDPAFANVLLEGMNSPDYMSVYPPLHQLVFALGAAAANGNLLIGANIMRMVIAIFEAGMFVYFARSAPRYLPLLAAYLLNPLVVVEGVGNVHFEAALLPLLAVAIHRFEAGKVLQSSAAWAVSVLTKLTPLMLAPAFAARQKPANSIVFFGVAGASILAGFAWFDPFGTLLNLRHGIGLYAGHFEFNASLYYLLRWVGILVLGYNPIAVLAPGMSFVALVLIVWVGFHFRKSSLGEMALVIYLIYFITATTVHPWYIIPVVWFAVCSARWFLLIWSYTIWWSYFHYIEPVGVPVWFTLAEYSSLGTVLVMEGFKRRWLSALPDVEQRDTHALP